MRKYYWKIYYRQTATGKDCVGVAITEANTDYSTTPEDKLRDLLFRNEAAEVAVVDHCEHINEYDYETNMKWEMPEFDLTK